MSLDPIETSQAIETDYRNYLLTTFHLKDRELQRQFEELLSIPGKFVKGPILEATPPFETGKSIEQLISYGVLSAPFRRLQSNQLPLDRPLYKHQELAIDKLVRHRRNLVVATGTGSGKTEAFLIPILDHLFCQQEMGRLTPGVRALLLYPMNALANDQMSRMRELLANYPAITFGRYTGETETRYQAAEDTYRKRFHREPLQNELISRDQMRDSPPHILLTNYAMLEYLLLRPDDHLFFDGESAQDWQFIVTDEAHTYSGAKGIEMGMLLRRLKDRIVESQPGRLQCIATSATLGKGQKDFPKIAQFASQLFGETFEWAEDDVNRQDVIEAVREPITPLAEASWGSPEPILYSAWQEILDDASGKDIVPFLAQKAREKGVPERVLAEAHRLAGDHHQRFFYEILKGDGRLIELRHLLEKDPQYLHEAARQIFGDTNDTEKSLVALVDIAVKAKPLNDHAPLLPARYHLFARAMEGAYVSLKPQKRLYLERREEVTADDRSYSVFETAVCRQCGTTYVIGETQCDNGRYILKQPGKKYVDDPRALEFYLPMERETFDFPADEDETIVYDEDNGGVPADECYKLCATCGAIDKHTLLGALCECTPSNYTQVRRVPARDGNVHVCPACGKRSPASLVWRFLTGKDATASVLATSLYQKLPPRNTGDSEGVSSQEIAIEDEWSSTAVSLSSPVADAQSNGGGRQLLVFSDSRQDAAFFAPYLNRTHSQILRRRLILQAIETHQEDVLSNRWRVQDMISPLQRTVEKLGLFPDLSRQEQMNAIWKWVLYELTAIDRRNSLEGLGCLGFSLVKPRGWQAPGPLMKPPWNMTEDEVWLLFQILLDSFRTKGAILFPDAVSPTDEFFKPRDREYYFRENQSSASKHIFSWSSYKSHAMNSRIDFLIRLVCYGLGADISEEECREVLRKTWGGSLFPTNRQSCWQDYFSAVTLKGEGTVYRMKYNFWELQPSTIDRKVRWYFCERCNNLTSFNLRGVCPTYRCDGRLQECQPDYLLKNNHYRNLYLGVMPLRMIAEEHTAQLTSERAAELQTQFIQGAVNVLSCSTTFELGVDVGDLESVFMRNVPPSSANYVQRAGRAGRRTDATAFALTFAQRRSHDLTHFTDPKQMVSGLIQSPHFQIENEKIVRRHVYATALAEFWKAYREMFRDVDAFFFPPGISGPERFKEFLDSRPANLKASLFRIVPEKLHSVLGLETWDWTVELFDENDGVLSNCAREVETDVCELEKVHKSLVEAKKPSDYILRAINTIKGRYLISFLSSRNVIPKYGFPVDVVELQILHHTGDAKRLELSRDLRIALSEYAPGSQVVAGGKLWTSRYLKRLPNKEWPKYRYAICKHCGCYHSELADAGQALDICKACQSPLEGRNQGIFLVPEFGFIVSSDQPRKPGDEPPERTYTTRIYYSGKAKVGETTKVKLRDVALTAIPASDGEMAVINHAGLKGFKVCHRCGYAMVGDEPVARTHETPWKSECRGKLSHRYALGHEFKTDILQLRFDGYTDESSGFWLSLLYGLLEGVSETLDIDRQDLDGCLYPFAGDPARPALVLFDDVPGGAGHVRRIAQETEILKGVFQTTLMKLKACECGGEGGDASCYGCLRNYRNQFCHDELNRGVVIDFLSRITA